MEPTDSFFSRAALCHVSLPNSARGYPPSSCYCGPSLSTSFVVCMAQLWSGIDAEALRVG